jgi:hypothetical protein
MGKRAKQALKLDLVYDKGSTGGSIDVLTSGAAEAVYKEVLEFAQSRIREYNR